MEVDTAETSSEDETIANCFARNILIPEQAYKSFILEGQFTGKFICKFAEELKLSPGIVVGRLQYDCIVKRSSMNHLKRKIRLLDL